MFDVLRFTSHPSVAKLLQLPKPVLHVPSAHAPPTHAAAALANEHEMPQPPQREGVDCVFTSHPLAGLASQSAKPASHVAIVHLELEQVASAWGSTQGALQAPQCAAVKRVSVSHPLLATPSQSPKLALHVKPHEPEEHAPTAFAAVHARPHAPHAAAVESDVSHPLAGLPSQSANPAEHTKPHAPEEHVVSAFGRDGHAVEHAPQCAGSLRRSTHAEPHAVRPVAQAIEHAPPLHTKPAPQRRPHAPQLAPSFCVSTSQPLSAT